jgi:hypothetical protein
MCDDASFDGVVAVYDTCDCTPSNDESIGCGDDTCGVEDGPPCVKTWLWSRCHLIRVGGKDGAQGIATLTLSGLDEYCSGMLPPLPEPGPPCDSDADCNDNGANEAYCVPPFCRPGSPGICYVPKNRYLSIGRDPDQTSFTGRRIKLAGHSEPLGWVGPPFYNVVEDMYFASVSDTAVFAGMGPGAWVQGDWPEVVHVKGCEIAPNQTYLVQVVRYGDEGDEDSYSDPLKLRTASVWGDVVSTCFFDQCEPPQGDPFTQPNIDDVLAQVNAFQGIRNAPLTWLDIDPVYMDGEPEGMWTLIGDVLAVVIAFQGMPYPGLGPLGCP